MNQAAILFPVIALVVWTFAVALLILYRRFDAVATRQARTSDFRYGESANVPARVCLPNRNYMNLLEAPLLFYVACLTAYVTQAAGPAMVAMAWSYVALRIAHSLVHVTYNNVMHRLAFFAASNVVLLAMWVVVGLKIAN